MRLSALLIKPVLYCAILLQLWAGFAYCAEPDDSTLFVEAFNAFQKKDFILVLEKLHQLNRVFPDTPLRDVCLLLQARAAHKSGDNELAAKSVNLFRAEFSDSTLKSTLEEDLTKLGDRLTAGEKLPQDKILRTAAQKVRATQLEQERAADLKAEQEKIARETAERERIARAKAEAERKERERLEAEMAAKARLKLEITAPESAVTCETGKSCHLPVQLVNKGDTSEEFLVSVPAAAEYSARLSTADSPGTTIERLNLAPGKPLKCRLTFSIPDNRVDGFRTQLPIKAVSARFSDVTFAARAQLTAAAPLIRVVARPLSTRVVQGKNVAFRIMVLNAGSIAARDLKVRIILPDQAELVGNTLFAIPVLEPGSLNEFNINLKISGRARENQELRFQVEVSSEKDTQKKSFYSTPAVIQAAAQ